MITGRYSALHEAHERIKTERQVAAAPREMTEARREQQARQKNSPTRDASATAAPRSDRQERGRGTSSQTTGRPEAERGVPKPDRGQVVNTPWGPYQAPAPEGTMQIHRPGNIRGARMEQAEAEPVEPPPKNIPALGEPSHHSYWRHTTTARIEAQRAKEAAREVQKTKEPEPLGFIPRPPEAKKPDAKPDVPQTPPSAYRRMSGAVDVGPGEDC